MVFRVAPQEKNTIPLQREVVQQRKVTQQRTGTQKRTVIQQRTVTQKRTVIQQRTVTQQRTLTQQKVTKQIWKKVTQQEIALSTIGDNTSEHAQRILPHFGKITITRKIAQCTTKVEDSEQTTLYHPLPLCQPPPL